MARDRGRSLRGQRCYDSKPKNWGDNITIIGALTLAGLEAVMTLNGALTKEWFKEWVKRFLLPGQTHQNRSIISGCYKIISQAYRWNEGIQSEYEHNENAGLATPRKRVPQATDLIITNKKQAPNACPF